MAELQEVPVYARLDWKPNFYGFGLPHAGICLFPPVAVMATSVVLEEFFEVELSMLWCVVSFFAVIGFVAVAQYQQEPTFLWRHMFKRSHRHFSPFVKKPGMPPFPIPRSELERL